MLLQTAGVSRIIDNSGSSSRPRDGVDVTLSDMFRNCTADKLVVVTYLSHTIILYTYTHDAADEDSLDNRNGKCEFI